MPPFFTVITATYNAAATLPRLLASLANQTCRDVEVLIQDGASRDETVAIAESYRDRLPALLMESAPDVGIYDAWNKALDRASGAWVLFLGADDMLAAPDVLAKVRDTLQSMPAEVVFGAGDLERFSEDGEERHGYNVTVAADFAQRHYVRMPFFHPALFTAGRVFAAHKFDAAFRIAGDYEWLLRVWEHEAQARPLGLIVTHMSLAGASNNPQQSALLRREQRVILLRHFPRSFANAHIFCLLYAESLLTRPKNALKSLCKNSRVGKYLWARLHEMRLYFVNSSK